MDEDTSAYLNLTIQAVLNVKEKERARINCGEYQSG
jgi:hypothetical protein